MIDRRAFIRLAALGLLAAPFVLEAQQPATVLRIGILGTLTPTTPEVSRIWDGFLQGLRELGYVEGQNMVIEARWSEGKHERLPELAADLVRLKMDVIVAAGAQPVHAAQRATTTIPIVAPNHGDPVGAGLAASLARPGGNVTGLSLLNPELTGKQLQLLSEAEAAARALGLQLQRLQARGQDDDERALSAMAKARADALPVLGDATFCSSSSSARSRPSCWSWRSRCSPPPGCGASWAGGSGRS